MEVKTPLNSLKMEDNRLTKFVESIIREKRGLEYGK